MRTAEAWRVRTANTIRKRQALEVERTIVTDVGVLFIVCTCDGDVCIGGAV